jgi:hypothetical protein
VDRRNTAVGYCYLIIFDNGTVKGGKSANHERRLRQHAGDAGKYGLKVSRYLVTADHVDYHESEKRLLQHLGSFSGYRRGEYFQDLSTDNAITAIHCLGHKVTDSEFDIPEDYEANMRQLTKLVRFTQRHFGFHLMKSYISNL